MDNGPGVPDCCRGRQQQTCLKAFEELQPATVCPRKSVSTLYASFSILKYSKIDVLTLFLYSGFINAKYPHLGKLLQKGYGESKIRVGVFVQYAI